MTPDAEKILNADVERIENFQSTLVPHIGLWWVADFYLSSKQKFNVLWNEKGYQFTTDEEQNQLPELQKIQWNRCRMGFGGRGSGFDTVITLTKDASQEDKETYKKILTPREIDGSWVTYPIYRYVPMLQTAFKVRYAYDEKVKNEMIAKKANQNLMDVLALKKMTYDLRQYG